MPSLPGPPLTLAGFTLAHAVWSVSDTREDELLTPLAVVERGGQRQLLRFEAETQARAIADGKATLAEHAARLDAWAFAREGTWRPRGRGGAPQDVLTVEFHGAGMGEAAAVVQPFARAARGSAFRLIGEPAFVVGGQLVDAPATKTREALMAGVRTHPKAVELWAAWAAGEPPTG
jgi:hypothetical protein